MARYDKNAAALEHIIAYCDRTDEARLRFGDSLTVFRADYDYRSCCSMYVYQIAEHCNHISADIKEKYANIPWKEIRGMRNIFAHDYDAVKINRLWHTMTSDFPVLREECLRILADLGYEYSPAENNELLAEDEENWDMEQ
ncbi:MAG: DUF86 domain-containing protein [Gracilibacteraceae bacterium]|jgi:uncharacterized protein with HEPN domain|nr:DUF86 domain-containing protein [Gracilibacteraceae bacterium]